jgi:hypothetical protein
LAWESPDRKKTNEGLSQVSLLVKTGYVIIMCDHSYVWSQLSA